VQPLPGVLVGKQLIFEVIANRILGVALAFLNKSVRQ
jgi:hypothetical protein